MWPFTRTSELVSLIIDTDCLTSVVCQWRGDQCVPLKQNIVPFEHQEIINGRVASVPLFQRLLADCPNRARYAVILRVDDIWLTADEPSPDLLHLGWHAARTPAGTWVVMGVRPELIVHYQLIFKLLGLPLACVVGSTALLAAYADVHIVSDHHAARAHVCDGVPDVADAEARAPWELERRSL